MTIWNSGEAPVRVNIRIDLYFLRGSSPWRTLVHADIFSGAARAREEIIGLQQIGYRLVAGDSDPLLLGGRVEAYGDPVRGQGSDEKDGVIVPAEDDVS
jgi:hypothetical protein